MSRTEIASLVTAVGDFAAVLRDADPADKAEVYRQLGLRLTYQPETQTVRAEMDLNAHRGVMVCVRGGLEPPRPASMHQMGAHAPNLPAARSGSSES